MFLFSLIFGTLLGTLLGVFLHNLYVSFYEPFKYKNFDVKEFIVKNLLISELPNGKKLYSFDVGKLPNSLYLMKKVLLETDLKKMEESK